MTTQRRTDGSDLPIDLLPIISNRLDDRRVDLPRIRAVCKSWRSSIPSTLPNDNSLRSVHIFSPYRFDFTVEVSTLYSFTYANSKSLGGEFFVKVRESQEPSKFSIFNPLYYHQGGDRRLEKVPKGLNLLDCHISEFQKTYKVHYPFVYSRRIGGKAAYSVENSTMLLFINYGSLIVIKPGDDKLTPVCDRYTYGDGYQNSAHLDLTLYNGKFYVINGRGEIIVIDSHTMSITRKMDVPRNCGNRNYFVQSRDDLYIVERCINKQKTWPVSVNMTLDFKIYKLNESDFTWVSVKSMGDRSVFISDDCTFMASLAGFSENSIYFTDDSDKVFCSEENYNTYGEEIMDTCYAYTNQISNSGVFTLEDSTSV